ncbi:MAG: hypothetical protein EHM36_01245 [Deltaproteobacteria bacterium]|nr:MAG: hypothetical protein EHM36_01245 [Deltaproteobacteria bacterium]
MARKAIRKGDGKMLDAHDVLKGFVDLHIHAGPSLMAREMDAWEMAQQAVQNGLAAIVIKDHHLPSVGATRIIQEHLKGTDLKVFGSIALNSPVGGLNPKAVEVAIGFGAKVVWMPTVSCENHIKKHSGHGVKFPKLRQRLTVPETPIRLTDDAGKLIPEAERVIEVMAEHPEVILATGHGDREEIDAIVKGAFRLGVKKILIDHPYYMVDATLDDMKAWSSLGAYIELTAVVSVPSSQFYSVPAETVAGFIRGLDPDRMVISSDYGQLGNGSPIEGTYTFVELLRVAGIDGKIIRKMLTENPSHLLGL